MNEMKKIVFIGLLVMTITACQKLENLNPFKKEHQDKPCAIVNSEAVPQSVNDAFNIKYQGVNVTTWFNKDGIGFCALFTQNGMQTIAQFSNDGIFVKEEAGNNQEGEHNDNNESKGCSCELEGGD